MRVALSLTRLSTDIAHMCSDSRMKDKWAGCSPSRTNRQRKYNNVVRLVFFPTCSSSVFLATWGQRKQVKDIADISWRLSWYGELVSKRLPNYESLWIVQITHCWLLVSHWTASLVKVLCSIYPAIAVGGTDDVNRRGQRLQNHIQVLALLALKREWQMTQRTNYSHLHRATYFASMFILHLTSKSERHARNSLVQWIV